VLSAGIYGVSVISDTSIRLRCIFYAVVHPSEEENTTRSVSGLVLRMSDEIHYSDLRLARRGSILLCFTQGYGSPADDLKAGQRTETGCRKHYGKDPRDLWR